MTRIIKFRAWDTVDKQMRIEALEIKDIGLGEGSVLASEEVQTDHPLEWMQFTGLLDSKGKEIYEGDIVRIGMRLPKRMVIGWWEDIAGWGFVYPTGEQHQKFTYYRDGFRKNPMEIIGDIYSNPELLK